MIFGTKMYVLIDNICLFPGRILTLSCKNKHLGVQMDINLRVFVFVCTLALTFRARFGDRERRIMNKYSLMKDTGPPM